MIKIFTGNFVDTQLIKGILESEKINCIIKNNLNSALTAGFGSSFNQIEIYVDLENKNASENIIKEYLNSKS